MDVTLADLLATESELSEICVPREFAGAPDWAETREVSWVVSARAMPPHLPVLRGRELLLIPDRVLPELVNDLSALLREARLRNVSAVVFPEGVVTLEEVSAYSGDIPVLVWCDEITPEVEAVLNRRLTEQRGNLYRIGSDLERRMSDLAASGAGLAPLAAAVLEVTDLPFSVRDAAGRELISLEGHEPGSNNRSSDDFVIDRELPGGALLRVGPLDTGQRIAGRFFIDRIAAAVEVAMVRDDAVRPRGSRRIEATEALILGAYSTTSEHRSAALALGLDPDAVYFIVIGQGADNADLARTLMLLGSVHPAGCKDGRSTMLVAADGNVSQTSMASRVAEVKRRWTQEHPDHGPTLALSAPAHGVANLPGASREARLVASLLDHPGFPKRAASFESIDDVGALRLLYYLRDSDELRQFVEEVLGELEKQDRRGTLRETLRAFLESGGSQVDASQQLGIHRNTLAYRLRRITELIGRDIIDPRTWLTLHLALRASEMLEALPDTDRDWTSKRLAST